MSEWQMLVLAVYPLVISPGGMLVLRKAMESGQPAGLFNWRTQSWAFLFGDTISLPFTVWFSLKAIFNEGGLDLLQRWWWIPLGILVGIAVGLGFRSMDAASYIASGNVDRLFAPTKLWHDYFVYITVSALIFILAVPAVLTGSEDGKKAAISFASFALLCICDMVRKPDPANMHPRVQDTVLARYA